MRKHDNLFWAFSWIMGSVGLLALLIFQLKIIGYIGLLAGIGLALYHFWGPPEASETHDKKLQLKKELLKFIEKKIESGHRLYNSKLKDVDEKILALKTFREWVNTDFEKSACWKFSEKYYKWRNDIPKIIEKTFKEKIDERFTKKLELFDTYKYPHADNAEKKLLMLAGPYRPSLKKDIDDLKKNKRRNQIGHAQ